MTEPYIGEIQIFGFDFAPYGWAWCNGAALPVRQYTTLFSLLGVAYGGDGVSSFKVPNLTARAATQQGQGPGLTNNSLGGTFGTQTVSLLSSQMPSHHHAMNAFLQNDAGKRTGTPAPGGGISQVTTNTVRTYLQGAPNTTLAPTMIQSAGNGQPHENRQPYLAMNFCIALQGDFPVFN